MLRRRKGQRNGEKPLPQVNGMMCERGDEGVEVVAKLDVDVADVSVGCFLGAPLFKDVLEVFGGEEEFLHGGWDVA